MRNKVIIGNWKMNKTPKEALSFCKEFAKFSKEMKKQNVIVGVGAPFIDLTTIAKFSKDMVVAAENCHYEEKGAFTGEVSATMLNEIGIKSVIVGHSERRKFNNETDVECNKKIKKLLSYKMMPIYCVGETLEEYEDGNSKKVVKKQLTAGLKDLTTEDFNNFVIAYEPVWAIGTGKNADVKTAEGMCKYIRGIVAKLISEEASQKVIIQYGGSVKTNNAYEYLHCPNIDGALVGGASLDVKAFKELASKALHE